MAQVAFSEKALTDVERLTEFLCDAAPDQAESLMRSTLAGLSILASHPRIGRPAARGLRELVLTVGKAGYVALYRYDEVADTVLVLRLRHQREAGYPSR